MCGSKTERHVTCPFSWVKTNGVALMPRPTWWGQQVSMQGLTQNDGCGVRLPKSSGTTQTIRAPGN